MSQFKISKINNIFLRIDAEQGYLYELNEYFKFRVPGYQHMPLYRSGVWDGFKHIFNIRNRTIYVGLLDQVKKFCEDRDYEFELVDFKDTTNEFSIKEAEEFISSLNLPEEFEDREYQVRAFTLGVRNERNLFLSPTGSGKSFIIYLLTRFFNVKTLLLVPTVSLVHQMTGDFASYGFDPEQIHKIHSGEDKKTDKQVTISTWQSVYKMDKKFFDQFDLIIGDEAHGFEAKSLTSILEKCNARFRFGFTGTLSGTKTNKIVLEGLFGPVVVVEKTADLINQGILSKFRIKCIVLKYSDQIRKLASKLKYQQEVDFIISSKRRNKFIKNLALSLSGNTLILYFYVENHGKILYDLVKEEAKGRNVYFVHGGVKGEERDKIRKKIEEDENAIIVASSGTFSTGINIKKLDNLIVAASTKSQIRILQSIGRILRKLEGKVATLYDLTDDLSWKKKQNYTLRHFLERVKIYDGEKFQYKIYNVNFE